MSSRSGEITTRRHLPTLSLRALKIYITAKDQGVSSLSSLQPVPVFVYIGSTFNIAVQTLKRTATTIKLRFIMTNVSLAFISHFGVVVQGADSIVDCKYGLVLEGFTTECIMKCYAEFDWLG